MPEPIISVSGLRGIIGESLSPATAMRYVAAFVGTLPEGPIVVTRDGRASGPMLCDAIRAAIAACGRRCLDGGVAATPTTGILVRTHRAAGGIQISASHNPPAYNGIKLFTGEGRVAPANAGLLVLERYRSGIEPAWVAHDRLGDVVVLEDTTTAHLQTVLATIDVAAIRARKFRVLLDANHGSGSVLGKRLLDELGCTTTILGGTPDGQFAHVPEPTAENLVGVSAKVVEARADIGFCQDPDADRLALIDELGNYIGEEYTPALCAEHVLAKLKRDSGSAGAVVTNCSTSRMIEDIAAKHGATFTRSAVGEANVVDEMKKRSAVYGGEGNGGVIDPRVGYVRDSFAGMALMLDALASRQLSLSRFAAELPRYEIVKTKITLPAEKLAPGLAALRKHFSDAEVDTLDGLRLDWPKSWLLVRASNTEPVVRAIAEAPTEEEAARLCRETAEVLSRI
ncbi:MAG: phosphoglucosamine mutase [Planctomycetia bacterium]|nr:phosphoglucosamine mutase [Planctomycetia bacterium]